MDLVRICCVIHFSTEPTFYQYLRRKLQPSAIQSSCMINEASKLCSSGSIDSTLSTSNTIADSKLSHRNFGCDGWRYGSRTQVVPPRGLRLDAIRIHTNIFWSCLRMLQSYGRAVILAVPITWCASGLLFIIDHSSMRHETSFRDDFMVGQRKGSEET